MPACIFCDIVAGRAPASIVCEDEQFVAFMDIYPFRPGHTLVVPRDHAPRLGDVRPACIEPLFGLASRIAAAIRRSDLPCDDLHLVLNDGPAANQSVPHTHIHILPRRGRDLPIVLRKLLQRPLQPLLGATPRHILDQHAATIRTALAG